MATEAKLQEELPFVRAELDSRSLRLEPSAFFCSSWLLWFGWTWMHVPRRQDAGQGGGQEAHREGTLEGSLTDPKKQNVFAVVDQSITNEHDELTIWQFDHPTFSSWLFLETSLCRNVRISHTTRPTSWWSHFEGQELNQWFWGTEFPGGLWFCWLCVVNIQFCTIFEVGACCSMHLTSFDKKIPFELLSYLGWSFHQRGQFPTTNGSAKFINCIQAMLTKTCSFKVPRCPERDVGPPRKAWRSTAVSLTDLSILEMLRLRSVFLLEPKRWWPNLVETSGLHISTVSTSCLVDFSCLLNMFASRLWWSCETKKLQNRC